MRNGGPKVLLYWHNTNRKKMPGIVFNIDITVYCTRFLEEMLEALKFWGPGLFV